MDQHQVPGSPDPKKDDGPAEGGKFASREDSAPELDPLKSGATDDVRNGALPNGILPLPEHLSAMNGDFGGTLPSLTGSQDPPLLDQSWRRTDANKSMGVLVERLAQQCYTDLNTALTKMSEAEASSQAPQTNGVITHSIDNSEVSLTKKRTFMEFANNQRDRFIKTLVLSDWSRNEEDMARLVDIKVWQEKQANAQRDAISFIGTTKHNMVPAKMPNPNIEDAMELLATGKSSRIPDIGYLPPKRLTATQLLKTLQDMNVTLSVRLNLHEDLPHYMNDFSVANGRATFRVPDEFEVDLSVADEDPKSPFYFIDIRFLFSPTSQILNDQLRAALEGRSNAALSSKGLQGCYELLHNFVLTHKINILHSQAQELQRDKWFACLRIETMRRNFVLQYWSSRPGPKNWLQVGISTGKQKSPRSRKPPTSRLSVQWFREGVEVADQSIDADWENICLNKILSHVIASHTTWTLTSIRDRLQSLAGDASKLNTELNTSTTTPEDCSLTLSLPSLPTPITIEIQPVTGQPSISPSTPSTTKAETRLSHDSSADIPKLFGSLLCSTVQERVGLTAELIGWLPVTLMRQDNLKAIFSSSFWQFSAFGCSKGWGDDWALIITFDLSGEKWFVARLDKKGNDKNDSLGRIISMVKPIAVEHALGGSSSISRFSLLKIEKLATVEVSLTALSQQFASMHIEHRFERLTALTDHDNSAGAGAPIDLSSSVALFVKSSALLHDSNKTKKMISVFNSVRVAHCGVEIDDTQRENLMEVRHELRLTVKPGKMKHLQHHLTQSREPDVAMSASGALALRIRTPFGIPFAEQIKARIRNAERLDHYLAVLNEHKFRCTIVGLSKLAFVYHEAPELSAKLSFSKDGALPARLKLEPQASNPHQRIRVMIENGINTGGKDIFTTLVRLMLITTPILQALDRIEATSEEKQAVMIHARQPTWYSLTYKEPFPPFRFEIRVWKKQKDGKAALIWHINASASKSDPPRLSEASVNAIKELYQQTGDDWWGIGNGLLAHPHGIRQALEKLDETVRNLASTMTDVDNAAVQPGEKENATTQLKSELKPKADNPSLSQGKKAIPPSTTKGSTPAAAARSANKPSTVKNEVIELD